MARYLILIPTGEQRWADASPQQKAAGYDVHGRFAALLAERGHTITAGAELYPSAQTTTITKTGGTKTADFAITTGPYAESVEHLTGFYAVDTDDLDDLLDCCRTLADLEEVLEIRQVVER